MSLETSSDSVLAGRLRVELDGTVREHGAGDGFDIRRGTAHRMSNAGTADARVKGKKAGRLLAVLLLVRYRDGFRLAPGSVVPWRSSHG